MHRSGSSLLAGMLAKNGFDVGPAEELLAPKPDNPKGFWERKDVIELNERIIGGEHNSHLVPRLERESELSKELQKCIEDLAGELSNNSVTLLKDPRFCITLKYWMPYLDNPKIVFLHRDPMEVAKSLNKRQSYPIIGGLALWEFYNAAAVAQCANINTHYICFNELIAEPKKVLENICHWYYPMNSELQDIVVDHFDQKLVHHSSDLNSRSWLSDSQKSLVDFLNNPNSTPSLVNEVAISSDSALRVLGLLEEMSQIGYHAGSGRLIDEAAANELDDLRFTKKNLTEEITFFRRNVANIINSKLGQLMLRLYSIRSSFNKSDQKSSLQKLKERL